MNKEKNSHQLIRVFVSGMLASVIVAFAAITAPAQPQANRADTVDGVAPAAEKANVAAVPSAPEPNPAPLPPPPGKWTGWYVGGHLGYGWGKADTSFTPLPTAAVFINLLPTTLSPDPRGIVGGGQFGYNKQFGNWVFGGEFSISASNMKGTVTQSPITQNSGPPLNGTLTAHQDTDWFATLRPRLGVLPTSDDRLLLYVTAGYAAGRVNYSANSDFRPAGTIQYPATFSKNKNGWTVGAGAEVAVSPHVSLKGEYLYYNLGNESITANPLPANPPFQVSYTWQTRAHVVTGGVNFHF